MIHIPDEVLKALQDHIQAAGHIVVLQADNPDGDSLASALALEAIFSEMGKRVTLVCGVDMPVHLRYLSGWDRVQKEVPHNFDAACIVDASSTTLFETLDNHGELQWIKAKPVIVFDHHAQTDGLDYAAVTICPTAVATGEVIDYVAQKLNWHVPLDAKKMIAVSILSDSMGFTSIATTSNSLRIIADYIDSGVDIAELENARRELMRREPELLAYKGRLLQRVELYDDGQIATVSIPWEEIEQYSHLYNPSMLVIDDMRMTVGVRVCIAFKIYKDGKITAKIRCNHGTSIAGELAAAFGGGGHPYASGFKITTATNEHELKTTVIKKAAELLQAEERKA